MAFFYQVITEFHLHFPVQQDAEADGIMQQFSFTQLTVLFLKACALSLSWIKGRLSFFKCFIAVIDDLLSI